MNYVHDNSGLIEQIEKPSDFSVFFSQVFIQEGTHKNIRELRNFIKGIGIKFNTERLIFIFT